MIINNTKYTPDKLFYVACRNSIHTDIKAVKQEYFDKNSMKGQGEMSGNWFIIKME